MPKRTTKVKGPSECRRSASSERRSVAMVPTPEEIERRAYAIVLARGGTGEHAADDRLQAERDLQQGNGKE